MAFATLYSYIGTYLAVRKAIVANEKVINNSKKYDKPCCEKEKEQKKGLFLLWCLQHINCFADDTDKLISTANRWAKNCGDCSVTQTEIDTFLNTEEGDQLIYTSNLSGFILITNGTWLLQQNGFQIIL